MISIIVVIGVIIAAFLGSVLIENIYEKKDLELKKRLKRRREMEARPHGWRY